MRISMTDFRLGPEHIEKVIRRRLPEKAKVRVNGKIRYMRLDTAKKRDDVQILERGLYNTNTILRFLFPEKEMTTV